MTVIINGESITSREELYSAIEQQLPEGYFSCTNLDALWDLCTEGEIEFTVYGEEQLASALGDYADLFLNTLEEAKASNPLMKLNRLDGTAEENGNE